MGKFTIYLGFLFLTISTFAQPPVANSEILKTIKLNTLYSELFFGELRLKLNESVIRSSQEISDSLSILSKSFKDVSTKNFTSKNLTLLKTYFSELSSFGESLNNIYELNSEQPYFQYEKITNTFIQYGVIAKSTYNTLRTEANERANTVVKEVVLPGLENFAPLTKSVDIKNFCLIVSYEVKDFSKDYLSYAECVAIMIPKSAILKYKNAQITDDQLVKLCTFYNVPKTGGSVKKISIKI